MESHGFVRGFFFVIADRDQFRRVDTDDLGIYSRACLLFYYVGAGAFLPCWHVVAMLGNLPGGGIRANWIAETIYEYTT